MTATMKVTNLQNESSLTPNIVLNADGSTTLSGAVNVGGGNISPQTGFKNRIINGAMNIWQRGTTFTAIGTGLYTADRWQTSIAGTSLNLTVTQSTSVPSVDYLYSLQFQQVTNAATSVTDYSARQRFELANVRDLAGGSVAVSFWYRSNVVGTHGVRIIPLGTTGGVDTSVAITVNSANTWEYKTVTITALSALTSWGATADNGAALILDIGLRVGGVGQTTINTNDYFNVTQVQLEKGSTATPFEFRSIGQELALCQRYFQASRKYHAGVNAANQDMTWLFPVTMRAAPSVPWGDAAGNLNRLTTSSGNNVALNAGGISSTIDTIVIQANTVSVYVWYEFYTTLSAEL
jgi:hypothetical protein